MGRVAPASRMWCSMYRPTWSEGRPPRWERTWIRWRRASNVHIFSFPRKGPFPLYESFLSAASIFAELTFLPTLAALLDDRRFLRRHLHWMLVPALGIILPLMVTVIAGLGEPGATTANYPVFQFVRMIEVDDYLQRLEPLFMMVIMTGYFIRTTFYLYALAFTLAEVCNLTEYRPVVLPLFPSAIT